MLSIPLSPFPLFVVLGGYEQENTGNLCNSIDKLDVLLKVGADPTGTLPLPENINFGFN